MQENIAAFRRIVWKHYRENGRHTLPWRTTRDSHRILVSELMLQQTQVERVIPFYTKFIKVFPTVCALARAPLSRVLTAWQGLGYNRRAKMLHAAAKEIVVRFGGVVPQTAEELESLPGVGPYTARAVAAFAYNTDGIVIETNIRTAVIHHFFPKRRKVSDVEIGKILAVALPKGRAREWYGALMDYGAHLKKSGARLNTKSRHYTKQTSFKGSGREARGAILRALAQGPCAETALLGALGAARRAQMKQALTALVREGFIEKARGKYRLAD